MQHLDKISTFNLFKFSVFILQTILSKNINSYVNLIYPFFQCFIGAEYFIPKEISNYIIKEINHDIPTINGLYNFYILSYNKKNSFPIHLLVYQQKLYGIKYIYVNSKVLQNLVIEYLTNQFGKNVKKQINQNHTLFPIFYQYNNIQDITKSFSVSEIELRKQTIKQLNFIHKKTITWKKH